MSEIKENPLEQEDELEKNPIDKTESEDDSDGGEPVPGH